MTDKEQIIINGVNVSGCKCYNKNIKTDCLLYPLQPDACKDNPNCYFKQLARKTQECEQLQEKYEALKLENEEGYEIVDDLKQEYEELKEELKREIKNTVDMERLAKSYGQDMLTYKQKKQIEIEVLQASINRYRKALEEIEEVINNILKSCLGRNTVGCRPAHNVCEELIKILDIINKTKGEV